MENFEKIDVSNQYDSSYEDVETNVEDIAYNDGADVASNTSDGGNMHIMIIVVSVCILLGLIFGIIAGKKAAK